MKLDEIIAVYAGSDGDATRALYAKLEAITPLGPIAVNLFRACKTSNRAKRYRRGRGHITESYGRKDWSVENAARILAEMTPSPFVWGWGIDEAMKRERSDDPHHHVVYFDLPTGQVSFHVGARHPGPDYAGKWDRMIGTAPVRICEWCWEVLNGVVSTPARQVAGGDDDESFSDRAVQAELDRAMGVENEDIDWLIPPEE